MLKICTILFLITCSLSAYGQQSKLDKLMWIEGKWNRTDVQGVAQAFEQWIFESNAFKGLGVMLEEKDTVFKELLSIESRGGKLYYIADVAHNTEPTLFEINKIGKDRFECTNETNDFPKKINYQLEGNLLKVTISGQSRSMDLIFLKEDE